MSSTKKLYAVMVPASWGMDFQCTLVEDTGEVLHQHISSTRGWGRRDLIGGMERNHNVAERFPEGYELVDVERWSDVPEAVLEAYRKREADQLTAPIETPPPGEWPDVQCDEYGQMTCPIPGCDEQLNLERAYMIPLIALTGGVHSVHDAVSDYWEVKCIGGHVVYTSFDQARATEQDETSEVAVEYDHRALHEVVSRLWGDRL